MAASTAEPPRANICAPACDASVWLAAAMPRDEIVMERACHRSWPKPSAENPRTSTRNMIAVISYQEAMRMDMKRRNLSLRIAPNRIFHGRTDTLNTSRPPSAAKH